MKNLLIIAYYFPPLGGSASLRPLKISKYLPRFEWNPVILTVKNPDWYYARDPELIEELPANTIIKRSPMVKATWIYRFLNPVRAKFLDQFIRNFFFHPDEQIGWIPFSVSAAFKMAVKYDVKIIYSTSGPLSCHLLGYFLNKKTGIPWIADFRDEWIEAPNLNLPTPLHSRFHYKLEKMVVNNADKVITMAPMFEKLLSKHVTNRTKIHTITAGFDPEDFAESRTSANYKNNNSKFIISFTGLFYKSFRPNNFIRAISELIKEGKIAREKIWIRFVGANTPNELDSVDEYSILEFTGFVPRKQAIAYLAQSDALLLLLSKERGKDVIPSKIFEYIGIGKPVLALVPSNSTVGEIIKNKYLTKYAP